MTSIQAQYQNKLRSPQEAVALIQSGDGVYIHSNAAAPQTLIEAMANRKGQVQNVDIYQLITLGAAPYAEPDCAGSFYVHALFVGPNVRQAVNEGRADYTPVFFSDIPALLASRALPVDVCLLSTSEPDAEGWMTLGTSLDCTTAARKTARSVIVEINKQLPTTFGENRLHISEVTALIESDRPLPLLHNETPGEVELAIGRNVASLVEDGATLQMGIGGIPNATLQMLHDKKDLGIHTEMFSDGVVELVEAGVINNSKKTVLPGKLAVSFAMGSRKLYDFIDKNPDVEFRTTDWINNPLIIAQNYKMTAINSAIQIDVTGQVCADSIGTYMYSGCGGQVDFVRGASHSEGGKAIIALESTAKNGSISRIVPQLNAGAGVVTSRADIHYVVTEYGIANLHGKNMKDRVKALIEIAHPSFRAQLEEACHEIRWFGRGFSVSRP
ncbi:MAG: hypothetical protein K2W82_05850 [Candidatus Obscuribacterales bacterium]|nr:hypothetical protein [Candidatus Obscuribacterales bacterium]